MPTILSIFGEILARSKNLLSPRQAPREAGLVAASPLGEPLSFELSRMAALGNLDRIVELLAKGADPKAHGSRALQWAARHGNAECVRRLIPLSNPKDNDSFALCQAARNGHAECVALLIPFSDTRIFNSGSLSEAARYGHLDCVKLLLPVADPRTSMALAMASFNEHIECIRFLIPFSNGSDAAAAALASRDSESLRILLAHWPSLDRDPHPFRLAIEGGHVEAAALMLERAPSLALLFDLNELRLRSINRGHGELAALLLSVSDKQAISRSSEAPRQKSQQAPRL